MLGYGEDDVNPECCGFDRLSQIADEMKKKYQNCKMGAITNGKQGGIIFNDLYNVDIEPFVGMI